jgi:hypothetical protein
MDWFEALTGFRETDYEQTQARLEVRGDRLHSKVNGASYGIGQLELASLESLRARCGGLSLNRRTTVREVVGDVRHMHRDADNAGALFQVASQFNLLEMIGPSVTPDAGVTCYQDDLTQGPACAIAAGAATIYRNYFAPVAGRIGQRADCQIDALSELGEQLAADLGIGTRALWKMQNGYALPSASSLEMIGNHLDALDESGLDRLRSRLHIGMHWDVEATEAHGPDKPTLSQAFCSAMPVAYNRLPGGDRVPLATLVLEAAYEATLRAAVVNMQRGRSNVVFLTLLGGGAFGNHLDWIYHAMRRAVDLVIDAGLDIRIVSHARSTTRTAQFARSFT